MKRYTDHENRPDQLHRHLANIHLLPPRLQSPRHRPPLLHLLRPPPTLLRLRRIDLDDPRDHPIRLSLLQALEPIHLLVRLHHANRHPSPLPHLEGHQED